MAAFVDCNATDAGLQMWSRTGVYAIDWWFHSNTTRCGCSDWDVNATDVGARIFMPTLYALGMILITSVCRNWFVSNGEDDEGDDGIESLEPLRGEAVADGEEKEEPEKKERLYYIDTARILCIAATVTEHSGGWSYSDQNAAFVQQWVLPFLYLISGMSFMLSSQALWAYELKLLVVLLAGWLMNYIGTAYQLWTWTPDFAYTLFQMSYVVVLMVMSLVAAPLRAALNWRLKNRDDNAPFIHVVWLIIYGFLALWAWVWYTTAAFWLQLLHVEQVAEKYLPTSSSDPTSPFTSIPILLCLFLGLLFGAQLGSVCGYSGWLAWILLALSYLTQMVIAYARGGHSLNMDLFIIGMVVLKWPLEGGAKLARVIREYWPFFFLVLLMMHNPYVRGRCDLHPMDTCWERVRFYSIEVMLIVALSCGALNTSDSYGVLPFLNFWALWAYCSHIMWARLLPQPYGAAVSYASVIPFLIWWCCVRAQKRDKSAATEEETEEDDEDEEE